MRQCTASAADHGWYVIDRDGAEIAEDHAEGYAGQLYLLAPDQPWMADDGHCEIKTSAQTDVGAAQEYVSEGDWGDEDGGKCSVTVMVWQYALDMDGVLARVNESTHGVDAGEDPSPPESGCGESDDDHDWEAPVTLVGGCRENPGVFATGGTSFRFESVCRACGIYKTVVRAGYQRNPGEPAERVKYRPADSDSLKWVEAGANDQR